MRKSHFILGAVAAVTFGVVASAPGSAQDVEEPAPPPAPDPMAPEAKAEYDGWPAEKQAEYDAWPPETQGYYWTLTPERQTMFWRLEDSDKIAITAMTGPERDAAWTQIENAFADPGPSEG